jgi:hypothetical protein
MNQRSLFDYVARPNLFTFASSERCQDAFLCWLLSWAHRKHRRTDEPLHDLGVVLMKALLGLCGIDSPKKYRQLEIRPQYEGIDILVEVNEEIVLLIEDKIESCEHSDQLRRYLRIATRDFPGMKLAPVYLKTGLLAYGEERTVREAGFHFFQGRDLLGVLRQGKQLEVKNQIFSDFLSHLERLDFVVRGKALRARGPRRPKYASSGDGLGLFASPEPDNG